MIIIKDLLALVFIVEAIFLLFAANSNKER
jgi:hypothetical protein